MKSKNQYYTIQATYKSQKEAQNMMSILGFLGAYIHEYVEWRVDKGKTKKLETSRKA